eukprot:scaffold4617_cov224-Amphora_coffeaeformis.AAC.1
METCCGDDDGDDDDDDDDDGDGGGGGGHNNSKTTPTTPPPIAWTMGGLALKIPPGSPREALVHQWLPLFFPHGKFTSFTRKLYRWGFRQVEVPQQNNQDPGTIGLSSSDATTDSKTKTLWFAHAYFQRDQPTLMAYMQSVTAAGVRRKAERQQQQQQQQRRSNSMSTNGSEENQQTWPSSSSLWNNDCAATSSLPQSQPRRPSFATMVSSSHAIQQKQPLTGKQPVQGSDTDGLFVRCGHPMTANYHSNSNSNSNSNNSNNNNNNSNNNNNNNNSNSNSNSHSHSHSHSNNNSNSNSNSNNNLPQPYPTCSLAWLAALMQQQQQQQQQQPFILAQPPLPQLPPNEAALQVALRLGLFSSLSSTTPSSTRQTPPTQPHVSLSVQGLPPTTSTSAEAIAAAALCGAWTNTATPHTHDNSVTRLLATLAAAWMAGGGGPTNTGFPATT